MSDEQHCSLCGPLAGHWSIISGSSSDAAYSLLSSSDSGHVQYIAACSSCFCLSSNAHNAVHASVIVNNSLTALLLLLLLLRRRRRRLLLLMLYLLMLVQPAVLVLSVSWLALATLMLLGFQTPITKAAWALLIRQCPWDVLLGALWFILAAILRLC
jgi:hypothetical protein